jgi:hypothetical protein
VEEKLAAIYARITEEYAEMSPQTRNYLLEICDSYHTACVEILKNFTDKKDRLKGLKLVRDFFLGLASLHAKNYTDDAKFNLHMEGILQTEINHLHDRYVTVLWKG